MIQYSVLTFLLVPNKKRSYILIKIYLQKRTYAVGQFFFCRTLELAVDSQQPLTSVRNIIQLSPEVEVTSRGYLPSCEAAR